MPTKVRSRALVVFVCLILGFIVALLVFHSRLKPEADSAAIATTARVIV